MNKNTTPPTMASIIISPSHWGILPLPKKLIPIIIIMIGHIFCSWVIFIISIQHSYDSK